MISFFRFFPRPALSAQEHALRQRRRLVKTAGLIVLAISGAAFLGFVLIATPGRLSGGEIGVIAALGAALFASRLVRAIRRINAFRWRR
ncbi:MAG TPA: hypothetical protein VFX03_05395 [Thermomicrobiales bacterium]|nr:hypothetical protein [Thermomicrobiales bacterium]